MNYSEIISCIIQAVTILGGGIALFTYRRNSRLKRAEWLYSLHGKFFEAQNYKRMRYIIDYEPEPEIGELRKSLGTGGNDELAELLVDYLNFFEFVASLWTLHQLSLKEIAMIFEYYIVRLNDHDFLMDFIAGEGFENLYQLVQQLTEKRR